MTTVNAWDQITQKIVKHRPSFESWLRQLNKCLHHFSSAPSSTFRHTHSGSTLWTDSVRRKHQTSFKVTKKSTKQCASRRDHEKRRGAAESHHYMCAQTSNRDVTPAITAKYMHCNGDGSMWLAAGCKVWAPAPLFQARIRLQTSRGHTYTKWTHTVLHSLTFERSCSRHCYQRCREFRPRSHGTMRTRDACMQSHGVTFESSIMHAMHVQACWHGWSAHCCGKMELRCARVDSTLLYKRLEQSNLQLS